MSIRATGRRGALDPARSTRLVRRDYGSALRQPDRQEPMEQVSSGGSYDRTSSTGSNRARNSRIRVVDG